MKPISLPALTIEAPAYAALHRQMHDTLLLQNPEWILPNGQCPTCDDYDRRFAELLHLSLKSERAHAC